MTGTFEGIRYTGHEKWAEVIGIRGGEGGEKDKRLGGNRRGGGLGWVLWTPRDRGFMGIEV